MRLIDADALFKAISDGEYTTGNIFKDMELQELIKSMPTAYDVRSVVEQLEEASYWTDPYYDEDGYSDDNSDEVVLLEKAIEIVKGGAV